MQDFVHQQYEPPGPGGQEVDDLSLAVRDPAAELQGV